MASVNKVLYNVDQRGDTTADEKATARLNIGAASDSDVTKITRRDTYNGGSESHIDELILDRQGFDSAVLKSGATIMGSTVPVPERASDEGKVPIAYFRDGRGYFILENRRYVPSSNSGNAGQVLTVDNAGAIGWEPLDLPTVVGYFAGTGIDSSTDPDTGDVTFSWGYSVGRNLHLNQNGAIQTNIPGGQWDAPSSQSNSFVVLSGADFAGAYRLACRHNTNDTYELALIYTASGQSSTITFIGTETVIGLDNSVTTKQAAYIGEATYYTPSTRFGGNASTPFDPTTHKAIYYSGVAGIGPTSDTKIAIWQDNGAVKIAFTSIEVGKVGATN